MNAVKPSVGMLPNERLAYSALPTRKPLKLPQGKKRDVLFWTGAQIAECERSKLRKARDRLRPSFD